MVSIEYCITQHDAEMCFYPITDITFFLLGNVKELLQKLDQLCFTNQHVQYVESLYTLQMSIQRKNCFRKRSGFWYCAKSSLFYAKKQKSEQNIQHREKSFLRKKYRKHLLSFSQKTKSAPNSGSDSAERIQQVRKAKKEPE